MTLVSIIIPCYNEEKTVANLLSGLYRQTYPHSMMEILIADGMSIDETRKEIQSFADTHPDLPISVIDNTARTIPAGLNLAINAANGQYIIRLDAHSIPAVDYVEKCVTGLEKNLGDNVGGLWTIKPGNDGWAAASIAAAASLKLGVGDANYRLNSPSGEVDTVPFGSFRKDILQKMGGFDESLLTNEDYELNTRIRKNGGKIWLDNSIRSTYFARATFGRLAGQYWRYGFWKAQMLKRYPETIRLRQALPPLFVVGLLGLLFISFINSMFVFLFLTIFLSYLLILVISSWFVAVKNHRPAFIIGIPVAIMIMHLCWGSGLIIGLMASPKKKTNNKVTG